MYQFQFRNKTIFSATYTTNIVILSALFLSACGKLPPILSNNTDSENRKIEIRGGLSPQSEVAILPGFPNSENEINKIVNKTKAEVSRLYAEVAAQKNKASFENTFKKLDQATFILSSASSRISVVESLSTDKVLKDAAGNAFAQLSEFGSNLNLRRDVYESLSAAALLPEIAQLKGPDATLVKKTLLDFKKSGVTNTPEQRDQIAKLNGQLSEEITDYSKKLKLAGDVITSLTKEDFAKLPKFIQEMIASAKINKDRAPDADYKIREGDQNVMLAIYTNCDDEKLRERAWKLRHSYAKEETMEAATKIINTRKALAKALGYKSWADYVIDGRMAENSDNVDKMYNSLIPKFNDLKEKETAKFIALKKEITGKDVVELAPWDLLYLEQKTKEKEFNIDTEALRDYFPLQTVINGTFNVYGNLFGISFEKYNGVYDKWNADVVLYKISDTKTKGLLGFVYLDLFARAGKENGAWMGGIIPRQTYKGRKTRPTAHVVLNLRPKINGAADTYLDYKEMETFFHEFGHAVHETLTQSPHASLAGASVEWDFVEAPSQTMEYFLSDSRILTQLSKHKVTGESIPLETTKRLEASGKVAPGYLSLRQTSFGKLDLEYYSRNANEPDFTAEEVSKIGDSTISKYYTKIPEGTGFTSSFSHIISGNYHGAYYAYMWADIVSADCAAKFRESPEGFVNPELGRQWREKVLEKGSTEKAKDMVKDFLGRDYTLDEFLKGLEK